MLYEDILYFIPSYNLRRSIYTVLSPHRRIKHKNQRLNGKRYAPFDQYHSIFVHIPKTAGVSVAHSLFEIKTAYHVRVSKYQIIFSQDEYNQYFKFAFVRNPWDRLVSAYRFLKK